MITEAQLIRFVPNSSKYAADVVKWFNEFASAYAVDTPLRIAAFVAQTAHESGGFRYVKEIASGKAYEGRKDLGNIYPGDGVKFKGRGLLQITGRANYRKVSLHIFGDDRLLQNPEELTLPGYAMQSAFWFWQSRNLNKYADLQQFATLTRRINGGLNGIQDRVNIYNRICKEFGLPVYKLTK